MIDPSELIINPNGSIYHLALRPEQLAHKIIIAGDPGRIESISQNFDTIEHKVSNREFVTHTGIYKNNRITALATGIGTDNIDIVLNEIDALVNVDLEKRIVKENRFVCFIQNTSDLFHNNCSCDHYFVIRTIFRAQYQNQSQLSID